MSSSRLLAKSTRLHRSHVRCILLRAYSSKTPSSDAPAQTPTDGTPASTPVNQGTLLTPRRRTKRRIRAPSKIVDDLPLLDLADHRQFPPSKLSPFATRVVVRNDPSLFTTETTDTNDGDDKAVAKREGSDEEGWEEADEGEEFPAEREDEEDEHAPVLSLGRQELEKLHRFPLITRRVTQQTGKGKIYRRGVLVVVGNGD